jgi:hypothetical protein
MKKVVCSLSSMIFIFSITVFSLSKPVMAMSEEDMDAEYIAFLEGDINTFSPELAKYQIELQGEGEGDLKEFARNIIVGAKALKFKSDEKIKEFFNDQDINEAIDEYGGKRYLDSLIVLGEVYLANY